MGVTNIGDSEFDTLILKQRKSAAVVFWANWNNASRAFMPTFEQVANENGHKLSFYKIDVDAASAVVSKFSVKSVPTTLLFNNGVLTGQLVGAVPRSQLASFIDSI